jgi:hypothetical protein
MQYLRVEERITSSAAQPLPSEQALCLEEVQAGTCCSHDAPELTFDPKDVVFLFPNITSIMRLPALMYVCMMKECANNGECRLKLLYLISRRNGHAIM